MIDPSYSSQGYFSHMSKAASAKTTWWVDKVPEDTGLIVDFGCGDGEVLREIGRQDVLANDVLLFGYDHNPLARALARDGSKAILFENAEALVRAVQHSQKDGRPTILLLSSVMHEVLSVSTMGDFMDSIVFPIAPDFIVFRDMAPNRRAYYQPAPPVLRQSIEHNPTFTQRLRHFVSRFGEISTMANLMHFLLKAPYETDWKAEMEENYFPMSATNWQFAFGPSYDLRFFDHHQPPFIGKKVKELCGGEVDEPTHLHMILERRRNG